MALFVQSFGLLLLVGGMSFGYWKWIWPHEATLTTAGRGLLLLVVATMMGGLLGSPFWWADQRLSFSWDLPPLASRMLAAAGFSFFAVSWMALHRPVYYRLRLILILLAIYLAPLALAILLFHLDRFDFGAPITYAFFVIAVPMSVTAIYFLFRQPTIISEESRDTRPAKRVEQFWLAIITIITGLWGLALFITDSGPSALIWAWPGDLLSSRLIGVMLLTIAGGSIYALRLRDPARMMCTMILVYSLGLTLAALWNVLFGLPLKTLYIQVFGVIFIVTAIVMLTNRERNEAGETEN